MPREGNFIKKETPSMVFSCQIFEIFKNTIFTEHLQTTTSESNIIESQTSELKLQDISIIFW